LQEDDSAHPSLTRTVTLSGHQSTSVRCRLASSSRPGARRIGFSLSPTQVDATDTQVPDQSAIVTTVIELNLSDPFRFEHHIDYRPLHGKRPALLALGSDVEELYRAEVMTTLTATGPAGVVIHSIAYEPSVRSAFARYRSSNADFSPLTSRRIIFARSRTLCMEMAMIGHKVSTEYFPDSRRQQPRWLTNTPSQLGRVVTNFAYHLFTISACPMGWNLSSRHVSSLNGIGGFVCSLWPSVLSPSIYTFQHRGERTTEHPASGPPKPFNPPVRGLRRCRSALPPTCSAP
jgi:hypothetical protein